MVYLFISLLHILKTSSSGSSRISKHITEGLHSFQLVFNCVVLCVVNCAVLCTGFV